jgi:hypothetical protein
VPKEKKGVKSMNAIGGGKGKTSTYRKIHT